MNHCASRLRRAQRLNAGHRRSGGPFATPAFMSARARVLVSRVSSVASGPQWGLQHAA